MEGILSVGHRILPVGVEIRMINKHESGGSYLTQQNYHAQGNAQEAEQNKMSVSIKDSPLSLLNGLNKVSYRLET